MKNLINFVVSFLVIFIGNKIAPEAIIIDSWKDAALAALIILGFSVAVTIIVTLISALIMLKCDSIPILVALLVVAIAISIAIAIGSIMLADYILPGFSITTHALIVVAIVNGLLYVPATQKGE